MFGKRTAMDEKNNELKEIMQAQIKCCEHYFNLPKRDLALQISARINHDNVPELLSDADKIIDWLNRDELAKIAKN